MYNRQKDVTICNGCGRTHKGGRHVTRQLGWWADTDADRDLCASCSITENVRSGVRKEN